jgi:TPR repeat protein
MGSDGQTAKFHLTEILKSLHSTAKTTNDSNDLLLLTHSIKNLALADKESTLTPLTPKNPFKKMLHQIKASISKRQQKSLYKNTINEIHAQTKITTDPKVQRALYRALSELYDEGLGVKQNDQMARQFLSLSLRPKLKSPQKKALRAPIKVPNETKVYTMDILEKIYNAGEISTVSEKQQYDFANYLMDPYGGNDHYAGQELHVKIAANGYRPSIELLANDRSLFPEDQQYYRDLLKE